MLEVKVDTGNRSVSCGQFGLNIYCSPLFNLPNIFNNCNRVFVFPHTTACRRNSGISLLGTVLTVCVYDDHRMYLHYFAVMWANTGSSCLPQTADKDKKKPELKQNVFFIQRKTKLWLKNGNQGFQLSLLSSSTRVWQATFPEKQSKDRPFSKWV